MLNTGVTELETDDLGLAIETLSGAYSPHRLSIIDKSKQFHAQYRAEAFSGLTMQTLSYGADVRAETQPFSDYLLLSQVQRGRYRITSREGERVLVPGDVVTLDPHTAYAMDFIDGCEMVQLRLCYATWKRSIAEILGHKHPQHTRFAITARMDPAFEARCRSILGFLSNSPLSRSGWNASEILRKQVLNLCVAALLDSPTHGEPTTAARAVPNLVKRALDYFEEHCQEGIGITDVCKALKVSPRGLQSLFQRELGITPMKALRDIRLQHVYDDLKRMSPSQTTVTEVAVEWGFANLGRFAHDFHQRFGLHPKTVFRA